MSYCRFGDDSDVYLYQTVTGRFECCACKLLGLDRRFLPDFELRKSKELGNLAHALTHLMKHKKKGHKVPDYALGRILDELGA